MYRCFYYPVSNLNCVHVYLLLQYIPGFAYYIKMFAVISICIWKIIGIQEVYFHDFDILWRKLMWAVNFGFAISFRNVVCFLAIAAYWFWVLRDKLLVTSTSYSFREPTEFMDMAHFCVTLSKWSFWSVCKYLKEKMPLTILRMVLFVFHDAFRGQCMVVYVHISFIAIKRFLLYIKPMMAKQMELFICQLKYAVHRLLHILFCSMWYILYKSLTTLCCTVQFCS